MPSASAISVPHMHSRSLNISTMRSRVGSASALKTLALSDVPTRFDALDFLATWTYYQE